ncbi:DUF4870 domain-containing protein [Neobacillus sp. YIM B06451]|uniref:DUF4870 domain-containing protein n=1 Tax=Neobacillus sp. YIM B06451 TaxID=3070994 RepID=UPI00292D0F98|nr:DUF4870 domain-containing protein [Neobacillus sp. YIM B06451]
MDTRKILSGLCYFSIFFAPFLFPIVVYFVVDDFITKEHAKKALLSHLIPFVAIPFAMLGAIAGAGSDAGFGIAILGMGIYGILSIGVIIWNVVKGIKTIQEL